MLSMGDLFSGGINTLAIIKFASILPDLDSIVNVFTGTPFYTYLAVFGVLILCGFGIPIPEDITLVAGGLISGLNPEQVKVEIVVLVGLAGVMFGDSFVYMMGRIYGERVLKFPFVARILTPKRFEKVQDKFDQYGNGLMFFARFMPGLRTPTYFVAGTTKRVSFIRFFIMDGLAALLSVPFWVILGHYGAKNRASLMAWVHNSQALILFILLMVVIVFVGWRYIKAKDK